MSENNESYQRTFEDRIKFYSAEMAADDTIEVWLVRIVRLAIYCDYPKSSLEKLETLITKKFVLGLMPGPVRKRLLEFDAGKLTLQKAFIIARQAAACARQVRVQLERLQPVQVKEPVGRSQNSRAANASGPAGPSQQRGLESDSAVSLKNKKCRVSKVGRISKVVRKKIPTRSNSIETTSESAGSSHELYKCDSDQLAASESDITSESSGSEIPVPYSLRSRVKSSSTQPRQYSLRPRVKNNN